MGRTTVEPGGESPRTALFATGTPTELKELGINLMDKPSCCVPKAGVQGCPFAVNCHKLFGTGRFKNINADFGPKSDEPGSEGRGAEYVGYYLETVEGEAKEDFMRCSSFMSSVFPRLVAIDDPINPSGEVIQVLGGPGTKIEVIEFLPEEPRSKTNLRMVEEPKVIEVPTHPRPAQVDGRRMIRRSLAMRRAAMRQRFEGAQGESRAKDEAVTHKFNEEGVLAPVVSEPAKSSEPVKRR